MSCYSYGNINTLLCIYKGSYTSICFSSIRTLYFPLLLTLSMLGSSSKVWTPGSLCVLQGVGERAPPESQLLKATLNECWFTGLFRGHHKNLLFISLQALRPMAMSLLVVFWSSPWQYPSMAFVLENKEVFVRLGANAPWCPVDSHQAVSEPLQAWTWGGRCVVTQAEAKQTLRGEPLSARTVGSGDLILTSYFHWWLLAFLRGPAPNSSWLFYNHSFGHRDPGFTGLLGPARSRDPWE